MSLMKRTDHWLPSVFDEMFTTDWLADNNHVHTIGTRIPAVNVKETDNDFLVEVAAPGMKKEDFEVELNNKVLTISSKTEEEHHKEDEKENFTRQEFSYHSFKRSFNLPDSVDNANIAAHYKDGVLSITLPKREEEKVKPKRLIAIG